MDLKFKFNAKEYSLMQGITPSALRKRRLSGKLEGQYIKKGSEFFYASPEVDGPNKQSFTVKNSRRRHVPRSEVRYHRARNGQHLQRTNDLRQLARINRVLNEDQIAEITDDIFEVAKQRRAERVRQQIQQDSKPTKNYGGWLTSHELDRTKFKPTRKEVKIIRTYY